MGVQLCGHADAELTVLRRTSEESLEDVGSAAFVRDLNAIRALDPGELAGLREAGRVLRQRSTQPQWLG